MTGQEYAEIAVLNMSAEECREQLLRLVRSQTSVHVALVRRNIAVPSIRSLIHVYGEKALHRWERGREEGDDPSW